MKEPVYYCNGRFLPAGRAVLPVDDLGVIRGFALFESLRTYGGHPFLLKDHLDRMFSAAREIGIRPPLPRERMSQVISRLIRKNGFAEALVRVVLTGGPAAGLLPRGKPTLLILADNFHAFPAWQYERGIRLMTAPFARLRPSMKSTGYFAAVTETRRAVARGFQEAVYVDARGAILEGTTYSVFAVMPGPRLVCPREGVLPGVTAALVIRLAGKLGIPVERHPITRAMRARAREMFITSSNRELIPVSHVDRGRIGDGKPGTATRRLLDAYRTVARRKL